MKQLNFPLLTAIIGRGSIWPTVFWGWVALVSLRIEHAPVADPSALPPSLAYSGISFEGLRFEQLSEQGGRIIVSAPNARFDQDQKRFLLESPELVWSKPDDDQSFTASGSTGQFAVKTDQTSLPSEFSKMQLDDGATVQSGKTAVEADALVFDNQLLLFEVLGRYEWKQGASKSKRIDPEGALYFDPIQRKINQNKEALLSARKPSP